MTFTSANAQFVTDRIAVGGDLDGIDPDLALTQLRELVEHGITHILDTRSEYSDEEFVAEHAPTVRYNRLGIDDAGQAIPPAWFEEGVAWLGDALSIPHAKALVHCHMGVNRSPSLVFAHLLSQGWDVQGALGAIRVARSIAVIDYADDALAWHHDRIGTPTAQRVADREALRQWRAQNEIDIEHVVREIRTDQTHRAASRAAEELREFLRHGATIIDDRTGSDKPACWLYQVNDNSAEDALKTSLSDDPTWLAPIVRHVDDVTVGDVVLLWRSGSGDRAGIIGCAWVVETGLEKVYHPRDWSDPGSPETSSPGIVFELLAVAEEPVLTRTELKRHAEFDPDHFELFAMPNRLNLFAVGREQLDRFAAILRQEK